MGAAEARALWQRTVSRRFVVQEDTKMAPKLACCHHQQHSSSSGNTEKSGFFTSGSFGDTSSDFSCDTKWWLKGSYGGFDEQITNTLSEDTKCKKLQQFVDLTREEEYYSFISKKDVDTTSWWRMTTGKDELSLLVAARSVDHNIQNCDLPPPQKLHKSIHCTSSEKGFKTAVTSPWKQGVWNERFERSPSQKSSPRSDDLDKNQLLEALRHSQTRAREAEKAAKEACAEKDRVITILLRQAGQILAYKQWLKVLEMESLFLQMKREEGGQEQEQEQIKGMNLKKRKKKKKKKDEIGKYMMAFALGFSLIGAGLLLGWSVGWLFTF